MNTLLAPQRPVYDGRGGVPDTLRLESRDPRITLLDRVALRVGLRLLLWSTRSSRLAEDRVRHARAYRHIHENALRERRYLREGLLAPRL